MQDGDSVTFTTHARLMMAERMIDEEWVLRAMEGPEREEDDPSSSERKRVFRRIPEFGDRWLRVVYEQTAVGLVVVTAFFDRGVR